MGFFTITTGKEAEELVRLGHDVNFRHNGATPLHHACKKGYTDIVKVLCKFNANVNKGGCFGATPLYYACESGYLDIVKVLCEFDADINVKNIFGMSPRQIAVQNGYLGIVKYFIEKYPGAINLGETLYDAAYLGHIDIVDHLLVQKEVQDDKYNDPLKMACAGNNIDSVNRLLQAGVDPNISSLPQCYAVRNNALDILKTLVAYGANYRNYPLLALSCEFNYIDIADFLIGLGCDVNQYRDTNTPLMHACKNNNFELVKLLLNNKADINLVSFHGNKAIDYVSSDEIRELFL